MRSELTELRIVVTGRICSSKAPMNQIYWSTPLTLPAWIYDLVLALALLT